MSFAATSTKSLPARVSRWVHWTFRPAQRSSNMYRGVYRDFAEANAAIGPTASYDSSDGAQLYRDRLDQVFPEDYPLLFWLRPLVPTLTRVFDFGGHVGLHWYAFRTVLDLPSTLAWHVSDVPQVASEGESLAKERRVCEQLKFSSGFDALEGCDLMMSSGALQYLEAGTLRSALAACKKAPKYVLLNKLPVRDGSSFVTVQDVWAFKSPYTVFGRSELIGQLQSLGYTLKASWTNPGHHCLLLGDADHSVPEYSGFYFVKQ